MTAPSPQQRKQNTTLVFNLVAAGYDNAAQRYFPFCADRLVGFLRPRPGSKLLDVGTGTGALATAAAQKVGTTGRVTAIDLAENMLGRAEENVRKMSLSNVDFHQMDGEKLEFRSNYFDAVAGSFCVFFFSDMLAGLKQWHRVLKPGGTMGMTSFSESAFRPLIELFVAQLENLGEEIDLSTAQKLAQEENCVALLEQAGFTEIETRTEQMGYHLAGSSDWWQIVMNSGLRGFIERLSAEQQAQLRVAHCSEVEELLTDKGLWLDVGTIFTRAKKPAV